MAIEQRGHAFGITGASWTATALDLPADLPFEDYMAVGWALGAIRDMSAWGFGDWLNYGEVSFGEQYAHAVEATGRQKATLLEYGRVARQVPRSRRRPELSWTHHQIVAAKESVEQIELLERAAANRWSVEEFRGAVKATVPTLDSAYPDSQSQSRSTAEILELVEQVARAVVRAAEPLGDGFARISMDLIDRLANALGESR